MRSCRLIEPLTVNDTEIRIALEDLEEELLSVIPRSKVITPDDLRGDEPSLASSVLSSNGCANFPLLSFHFPLQRR
jgi:hypothetical protein